MIVFYHIPKTAGISVTRAAAQAIPGVHRRVLLTEMRAWLAELHDGRAETDDIAFLSGHFGYGVHPRFPGASQTMTFLRDPIEQTVSMHAEATKRPDIYPHGDLRTLLSSRAGEPYFGNAQVRHLASADGGPVLGALSEWHLARAKDVLAQELTCFGVTEHFVASIALINARLGTHLAIRRDNVSTRLAVPDLDPDLFLLIWEANALDRELYAYGRQLFLERLRATPVVPHPALSAVASR